MTIRDLFTHQSGLTYGFMERTNVDAAYRQLGVMDRKRDDREQDSARDASKLLAELPLEFSPGTRWNYSVSTDVLGYLVEVISGSRFDAFLHERIFEPLGMVDTGFSVPDEKLDRFAANYAPRQDETRVLQDDPETAPTGRPRPSSRAAAAGLHGGRLPPLLPHAAQWRRARRRATARPQDDRADDAANHLPGGCDLDRRAPAGAASAKRRPQGVGFGLGFSVQLDLREVPDRGLARASSPGAAPPAPPSGSTPPRS